MIDAAKLMTSVSTDLLYPTIANKNGQWVVNQDCMKKCGLQMVRHDLPT